MTGAKMSKLRRFAAIVGRFGLDYPVHDIEFVRLACGSRATGTASGLQKGSSVNRIGGDHEQVYLRAGHSLGRGICGLLDVLIMNAKYQERLEWLIRQQIGARAERYGFVDASLGVTAPFSGDDYEQMRYKQGFDDGRAILEIEEQS